MKLELIIEPHTEVDLRTESFPLRLRNTSGIGNNALLPSRSELAYAKAASRDWGMGIPLVILSKREAFAEVPPETLYLKIAHSRNSQRHRSN